MKSKFRIKPLIIFFIAMVIVLLAAQMISKEYTKNFTLGGTYVCKELPFDVASFDIDGSMKFAYYSGNEQKKDTGTFKKTADGVYVLNSLNFKNQELVCFKEFPFKSGFRIKFNGIDAKYYRINKIPGEIN